MFKRLTWFTLGTIAGAVGAAYGYVRVRELRGRVAADGIAETIVDATRSVASAVRDAVAEGREAMAEAEAKIKADLDARSRPG
jgi:hypothetical protein